MKLIDGVIEPDEKELAIINLRQSLRESIKQIGEVETRENIKYQLKILTGKE